MMCRFDQNELDQNFHLLFTRGELEKQEFLSSQLYRQAPMVDACLLEKMAPYEWELMESLSRIYYRERNFESRKNYYYTSLRFWRHVIESNKIGLYLCFVVPHSFHDLMVYYLCKVKKIRTIIIETYSLRHMDHRYYLMDSPTDSLERLKKVYENLREKCTEENLALEDVKLSADVEKTFQEYAARVQNIVPQYMKTGSPMFVYWRNMRASTSAYMRFKLCFMLMIQLIMQGRNNERIQYIRKELNIRDYLHEDINAFEFYDRYATAIDEKDRYVYAPLHASPEAALLPRGGRYENSLLYLQLLSASLPEGYWIYVKEHPSQRVRYKMYPLSRSVQFYSALLALGNVKLIGLKEETFSLIERSLAVATVTGTAGFEAICRNKPCLMFGWNFFQHAPGVYQIKSLKDCQRAIGDILAHPEHKIDRLGLKLYLLAMEKNSYLNPYRYDTEETMSERENLLEALYRKIN